MSYNCQGSLQAALCKFLPDKSQRVHRSPPSEVSALCDRFRTISHKLKGLGAENQTRDQRLSFQGNIAKDLSEPIGLLHAEVRRKPDQGWPWPNQDPQCSLMVADHRTRIGGHIPQHLPSTALNTDQCNLSEVVKRQTDHIYIRLLEFCDEQVGN